MVQASVEKIREGVIENAGIRSLADRARKRVG
jgi:hypothetical protein